MSAEGKTAAERKVAWERIREILPRKKTPEDKKRRKDLFKKFDADGSKALTLDETYQGLIDHCHLDEFTTRLKDITKRAFNKAKGLGGEIEGKGDDDQVEFREFRLMLCYIYDYFELTVMFDEIDADGSMMIDEQEFKDAVPKIEEWGVPIADPEATFRQIDANGSGKMTFDEFCSWASAAKLDADGDPDNTEGGAAPKLDAPAPAEEAPAPEEAPVAAEEAPVAAARSLPGEKTAAERKVAWERIREILPRKKTPEDKKRRIDLFKKFDADGSKALTLDETYQGLIDHCQLDEFTPRVKDITVRAFNKAKGLGGEIEGKGDDDQVEFREFRLMLCYIYDYFELTVMFDEIDADGSMMIDEQEFKDAVPKIEEWGVPIADPEATFRQIDDNGSGKMTFDEFCSWASAAKLDADGDPDNTEGGAAPKLDAPAAAEEAPAPEEAPVAAARSLPGEKTAAERKVAWERIREILPRKKTPEDKKRRIDLFKKFDADGSKALTLDETYQGLIDHCQLDEFTPRVKDITVRAFNKAKGLGGEIEGKGDDDQVEFREFRLMLCYIYDYFELTVMFDEIDADGSMMIDEQEFKDAVPKIEEWGVPIADPEATFRQIDANGSGKMTFDEFCSWASAAKLDADGDPDNTEGGAAPKLDAPAPAEEEPDSRVRVAMPDDVRARSASRAAPEDAPVDGEVATRVFKKMPREVRERRSRIREERLSGIRGSRIGDRSAQAPPLAATAPEPAEDAQVPPMAEDEPVAATRDIPVDEKAPAGEYPVEDADPAAIHADPVNENRAIEPAAAKADSPNEYPTEEPAAAGAARGIDDAPAESDDELSSTAAKDAAAAKEAPKKDAKKDDKKDDKDEKKDEKKEKDKGGCCMVM